MESNSPRGVLNSIDWVKIGKGLLIALVGAFLTYLTEVVANIDFGSYSLLIMAGWSGIVNIIRKWLVDHTPIAKQFDEIQPTE